MAVNKVRNIAPFINDIFYVTSEWWTYREGKLHRGLDIATSVSKPVYSILDGKVHSLGYNSTRGNWIIIRDPNTKYATLYMHLKSKPLFVVGQSVSKNQFIGNEGSTGDSTGIHLHVEMQIINEGADWVVSDRQSDYLNPCEYMGIDNEKGTAWKYNGKPIITSKSRNRFKFYLYGINKRNMI